MFLAMVSGFQSVFLQHNKYTYQQVLLRKGDKHNLATLTGSVESAPIFSFFLPFSSLNGIELAN